AAALARDAVVGARAARPGVSVLGVARELAGRLPRRAALHATGVALRPDSCRWQTLGVRASPAAARGDCPWLANEARKYCVIRYDPVAQAPQGRVPQGRVPQGATRTDLHFRLPCIGQIRQ